MGCRLNFQKKESCNKCGGNNEILDALIDAYVMFEADTRCKDCGFEDHWAEGLFESRIDGLNKAERVN